MGRLPACLLLPTLLLPGGASAREVAVRTARVGQAPGGEARHGGTGRLAGAATRALRVDGLRGQDDQGGR